MRTIYTKGCLITSDKEKNPNAENHVAIVCAVLIRQTNHLGEHLVKECRVDRREKFSDDLTDERSRCR